MPLFLAISRLALPNLVAFAAQLMMTTVDGIVAANLGSTALAAVALMLPLQMLIGQTSNGAFGAAVSGMIARATGAADAARTRRVAWHALLTALAVGIAFSVAGTTLAPALLAKIGGVGDVLSEAVRYAVPIFIGCIGVWIVGALSGIARGQGRMWLPAVSLLMAALVHVFLAPQLAARAGIAGIATSWAISYSLALIPLIIGIRRSKVLGGLREFRWQNATAMAILRIGIPSIGSVLLTNLAVILATRYAASYGTDVLIGFGIGARLEFVLVPFAFSIGLSLIALAGQSRGAGDHQTARRYALAGVIGSGVLLGIIGSVVALFPHLWLRWFDTPPAAYEAGAQYLRHVGPFYLFFGFGLTAFFASQAFGRIAPAMVGAFLRAAGVGVGGLIAAAISPEPLAFFVAVACAFTMYGLMNLYAIHTVSRVPAPAPQPAPLPATSQLTPGTSPR